MHTRYGSDGFHSPPEIECEHLAGAAVSQQAAGSRKKSLSAFSTAAFSELVLLALFVQTEELYASQ